MNYIGSKKKLINFLLEGFESLIDEDLKTLSFLDGFGGTGTVAYHIKPYFKNVSYNELLGFSKIIGEGKIRGFEDKYLIEIENQLKIINNLEPKEGFFFQNYSKNEITNNQRTYFTPENAKKIDSIIWYFKENKGKMEEQVYFYLFYCSLEAIDKVANVASVYGAYLKQIKKTASKKLEVVKLPVGEYSPNGKTYNLDINQLFQNEDIDCDVVYLDPPYNSRDYYSNYHILETIANLDEPEIKGKTGTRVKPKEKDSKFSKKRSALEEMKDLLSNISKTKTKYIFISYNDEGIISLEDFKDICELYGDYFVYTKEYQRFKSNHNNQKQNSTVEYLHCIKLKKNS